MSATEWWTEGLTEVCAGFQLDLSCLVDGELDEHAASRAVAHLEHCEPCREFFEDTRLQISLHRDMVDPDRLKERYEALTGLTPSQDLETLELVQRLSTVFYQLGKAYTLLAIDRGFRLRVFEEAVKVEPARTHGRGFVDGVLETGRGESGGVDWSEARRMLNGRLTKIEGALEKGRRLLHETLGVDSSHEEARLYLAYIDSHEGKNLKAAREFERIFQTAIQEENRAHAAVHLGLLHASEGDYKKAIACYRWVTMSGLADSDDRFFVVRFNIGMNYARLRDRRRALAAFRDLLDRHPDRVAEIASFFARTPRLRALIDAQPGFAEALCKTCPELFGLDGAFSDSEESH